MPLLLSDQDFAELQAFAMRNFRGDEINLLQQWLVAKRQAQRARPPVPDKTLEVPKAPENGAAVSPSPADSEANGHDANPYPSP